MPFSTHKDNLVYALWARRAITRVLLDLTLSPLRRALIGGAMNEYALSLYKGAFVNTPLFNKQFKYNPSGHVLNPIVAVALKVLSPFRRTQQRPASSHNPSEQHPEQHLKNLVTVLEMSGFDQDFIDTVVKANESYLQL